MGGACRAQGRLIAAGIDDALPAATATAPSAGGRTVQAVVVASARPQSPDDPASPPATGATPAVDGWFGWFGSTAAAGSPGGDASDGPWPWLAVAVGLGLLALLALIALAARTVHVPFDGQATRDRWRSILGNARAARSELGEALPLFLILLLAATALAFWLFSS